MDDHQDDYPNSGHPRLDSPMTGAEIAVLVVVVLAVLAAVISGAG